MVGHNKGYYVTKTEFSVAELKVVIDALLAASFITEEKTKELVSKIAALGGSRKKDILKKSIICFNTRKHTNDAIYDTTEAMVIEIF